MAAVRAGSLTERPLFCDLLSQAPMNLERNVSLEAVRAYKLTALASDVQLLFDEAQFVAGHGQIGAIAVQGQIEKQPAARR